ncbi:stage V sporulation protein AC [Thermobrachium celere]|uniref:Stage V sporulation protein AC (SpoVAC) n=1 Tax=Thermobrachium celere DSM 8682 TaxID=941824 RepID=R7RQJ4_9CLOT|nr:stage V sporulation protein AC [Thermobrachium celere]CDF58364.1 Stage V sporulation protein AC (SpoVAC) [Thermobrachium celere DSM 8682]
MEHTNEERLKKEFQDMVKRSAPSSNFLKDCLAAFVVGGLICVIGQFVMNFFINMGIPKEEVGYYVATIMVFLGAFLTGIGVYDNIGKFAGAGSIVPITGFSNSIVAPAMEFKREGFVFGVGAKMFVIAGPVLVYGISSSVIVGIIYYIMNLFK